MIWVVWGKVCATIWTFVSLLNLYVEILTHKVMLTHVGFGKKLSPEARALKNGISALIKEAPDNSLSPFHHSKKMSPMN